MISSIEVIVDSDKECSVFLCMDSVDARNLAKELLYFAEEAEDHNSRMYGTCYNLKTLQKLHLHVDPKADPKEETKEDE